MKVIELYSLADFIEKLERTDQFGVVLDTIPENDPGIRPVYVQTEPIVGEFVSLFYKLKLCVKFDWMQWSEGTDLLSQKDIDFSQLNTVDLCRILTVVVRKDRFIENYLLTKFEDRTVLKILKAMYVKL